MDCNSPLPAGRPPALSATAGAGGSPSHRTDASGRGQARNDGAQHRHCERTQPTINNAATAFPAPSRKRSIVRAFWMITGTVGQRETSGRRRPRWVLFPANLRRASRRLDDPEPDRLPKAAGAESLRRCAAGEEPPKPPPGESLETDDRPIGPTPRSAVAAGARDWIGNYDPASAGTVHGSG